MSEQRPSGFVTPEAVILEFETGGVGSRAIAKFIDVLIQIVAFLAVALVLTFALGAAGGSGSGAETIVIVLVVLTGFLILFGYPAGSETLWNGKTVGKAALGLRVVTREGAPIRFRHSAIRAVTALVEIYAFAFVSILTCVTSRNNQRVGDLMGGTIVIRERTAGDRAVAVSFPPPPGLESYVRSLDVSSLTSEQYGVVRSFLMRVFQFTPEARMALAVRLANPVAVALHHDPPPMIGPELFLACVAAAYQARHGGPAAAWAGAAGAPAMLPGYGAPPIPGYGPPQGDIGWSAPSYAGAPSAAYPGTPAQYDGYASAQPGYGPSPYGPPGQPPGRPGYGPSPYGPPGRTGHEPLATVPGARPAFDQRPTQPRPADVAPASYPDPAPPSESAWPPATRDPWEPNPSPGSSRPAPPPPPG